jgi:hypothetical protein
LFQQLLQQVRKERDAHDLCRVIEAKIAVALARTEITIHAELIECDSSCDGKEVGGACEASVGLD